MTDLGALGVVGGILTDLALAGLERRHVRGAAMGHVVRRRRGRGIARRRALARDACRERHVRTPAVVDVRQMHAACTRFRRAAFDVVDDPSAAVVEAAGVDGDGALVREAAPALGVDAGELAVRAAGGREVDGKDAGPQKPREKARGEDHAEGPGTRFHDALPVGDFGLVRCPMSSEKRLWSILALGAGVAVAGCSSANNPDPPAPATEVAPADPDPPAPIQLKTCAIGTMVGKGGTACVPVGPDETAPDGFKRSTDDWGFRAVNVWGLCPDRFMSVMGSEICRGIDIPCPADADFPPSGSTLVHDQTELAAAMAATGSGSTIALADGTYDPIVIDRDVTLIGRCPERAFFRGDVAGATGQSRAISIKGAHTVSLHSITVQNAGHAIWASDGAKVAIERMVFASNGSASWIQNGASLKAWHVLVKGADAKDADGILVGDGGHADLDGLELRDMHVAVQAFGSGSTVTASEMVISDRSTEPLAALVIASHGGDVQLARSLVFAKDIFIGGSSDIDARETGSLPATLKITDSEIMRVDPSDAGGFDVAGGSTLALVNDTFETRGRVAISAHGGANVSLERTVIRPVLPTDPANRGIGAGLVIDDGVRLTLDRSAIMGVVQSGVMASKGCHIRATGSLIADVWEYTRMDFQKRFDSGQAISLSGDAALDMTDSALLNNAGASIWLDAGGQASVKLQSSVIASTRDRARSSAAVGLLAWSGTVDVRDSLVHDIGTAFGFGKVTGAVAGTTISKGDVAFRFSNGGHSVVADSADQRPAAGELLTRDDVLVETPTAETQEALPLGDCRCEKPAKN